MASQNQNLLTVNYKTMSLRDLRRHRKSREKLANFSESEMIRHKKELQKIEKEMKRRDK